MKVIFIAHEYGGPDTEGRNVKKAVDLPFLPVIGMRINLFPSEGEVIHESLKVDDVAWYLEDSLAEVYFEENLDDGEADELIGKYGWELD